MYSQVRCCCGVVFYQLLQFYTPVIKRVFKEWRVKKNRRVGGNGNDLGMKIFICRKNSSSTTATTAGTNYFLYEMGRTSQRRARRVRRIRSVMDE